MTTPIANQGEIRIDRIDALPEGVAMTPHTEKLGGDFIISHSGGQGHHHVLGGDVDVMEAHGGPEGMRIFHVIVRAPTALRQTAAVPHRPVDLAPGIYSMRIKREFDPFGAQIRAVAD
ncbi:MAG: hypothetical protein KA745_00070 [Gemmatimonadales bacterium]|nr:hypothetical protein [Gemmatimonadales bacterium]